MGHVRVDSSNARRSVEAVSRPGLVGFAPFISGLWLAAEGAYWAALVVSVTRGRQRSPGQIDRRSLVRAGRDNRPQALPFPFADPDERSPDGVPPRGPVAQQWSYESRRAPNSETPPCMDVRRCAYET